MCPNMARVASSTTASRRGNTRSAVGKNTLLPTRPAPPPPPPHRGPPPWGRPPKHGARLAWGGAGAVRVGKQGFLTTPERVLPRRDVTVDDATRAMLERIYDWALR